MKKFVTIVSVTLLVLLALAATGTLMLMHPWVQLRLTRALFSSFSERTATEIGIGAVRVTPRGEVLLEDLHVREADGSTLLALDEARGVIDFRALFDRSVEIRFIELFGAEVNLRPDSEGQLNIARFATSLGRERDEPVERHESQWRVHLGYIRMHDGAFSYDPAERETAETESHERLLRFSGIELEAHDMNVAAGSVGIDLRRLAVSDALGVAIEEGELQFALTPYEIRFDHLTLRTRQSTVRASVSLSSVEEGAEPPARITAGSRLAATIFDTRVAGAELQQLARRLLGAAPLPEGDVDIRASLFGPLDDVQIPVIDLTLGETNHLEARGRLQGLLSPERFAYQAVIERLEFGREQAAYLRGDLDELPFVMPQAVHLAGTVEGDRTRTQLDLWGDSESLGAKLELDLDRSGAGPRFAGTVDVSHADLRALGLLAEPLGLRGRSAFDVTFVTPADFTADLQVRDLELREPHRTHSLERLDLSAASEAAQSRLALQSELATVDFRSDLPFGSIAEDVLLHLQRYVAPAGNLVPVRNENLERDGRRTGGEGGAEGGRPQGSLELSFAVHRPLSLLVPLIPQLHELAPLSGTVSYDGSRADLAVEASIDRVVLEDYSVTGLTLRASSAPRIMLYEIRADALSFGGTEISAAVLQGDARGNTVSAYARFADAAGAEQMQLGVRAAVRPDHLELAFEPRSVVVRGQRWDVAEDHAILLGRDGVAVRNLRFVRDQTLLSIDTEAEERARSPLLNIRIEELEIGTVVPLLTPGDAVYSGTLSADLQVSFEQSGQTRLPLITGSLEGRRLVLADRDVGDVAISVAPLNDTEYRFDGTVRYEESTAALEGTYRIPSQEIDLTVMLERLDIDYLAGYIPDEITDAHGHLVGSISVTGPITEPDFRGEIALHDARFTVRQLGTGFSIGDEVITLSRSVVTFEQFTVRDVQGNRLLIDGTVALGTQPEEIVPNLTLRSDRFVLLDTTRRQNERFFGRLVIGSNLRIGGNFAEPEALGALELQQGSAVTFVLPDPGASVAEAEGVVRFTDRPRDATDAVAEAEREAAAEAAPAQTVFRGMDVTANLQVDGDTMIDLVVDDRTGDRLRMRGGGDFSLGIDPTGTLSLAGEYVISEGNYVLSFYNITRREFAIASGSSVVWTGDPLDADLDVRAIYTVRASVGPLLAPAAEREERSRMMGELPFQVVLSMQGSLTGPEIEFTLDMPPQERGAMGGAPYAAISQINEQESRRNTQAFSLIVLNQFIADDLSGIDETAVVAAGARASASRLLTYQLNALSRRAIPGVDITFEVESYEEYTEAGPEGRTEIGVQVSQRLLDDRLIVRFGGQIDVEGEASRQAGLSEIAGDLSVEYLLTPDGRYRIRGFREQEYHGLLDGALTTTGLSFVFSHEFDRLPRLRPRSTREALESRDEPDEPSGDAE